jgi:hypothetical protein
VDLGGVLRRVIVFSSVLVYSRGKHHSASLDARQDSVYGAIEDGFWHFDWVAKQLLVYNDWCFVADARPRPFAV